MPSVKESGKAPAQMSAAAIAAEERIAKKTAQMEAGTILITQAARQAAEAKEELEKAHEARKEERRQERERDSEERNAGKRDTSELSKQSKWFGIEGKLLKDADIKWTLEMEEELWMAFQEWIPAEGGDLTAQIEELSRLYLALLDAILTHTLGEEQAAQMDRLEQLLSQKLNLLLDTDLEELINLLEQTEQTEAVSLIKSSVYRQTTGKPLSYKAADRFYTRGSTNAGGNSRYFMPDSSKAGEGNARTGSGYTKNSEAMASARQAGGAAAGGLSSQMEEGRLYGLAKGRTVQMNQEFDAQRQSSEIKMSRSLNSAKGSSAGSPEALGGKTAVTGKELVSANRFAAHMNGSGNLLSNPDINAKNEEILGLLAAITSIKNQVYAANYSQNSGMRTPLRSAVNQMIDYYLTQKGVYRVYDYTTNVYESTKSPQKAVEEGLEYAYRIFMEKKGDTVYQQQDAYSERAGFFQMLLKNQTLQADLIRGMKLLEGNWREFLKSVGEDEKKGIVLKMQKHSPWGALMEPEEFRKGKDGGKDKEKMPVTEIVCAAALVIVYLCYRLFFM